MRTNYQMMNELNNEYTPKQRGIVSMSEIYKINEALELDKRDVLDLRNLRDFAVYYWSTIINALMEVKDTENALAIMDKQSAILTVIDQKIANKGGEI